MAFSDDLLSLAKLNIEAAEIAALDRSRALLVQRVFNNATATDGSIIGNYRSKQHVALRRSLGRQVSQKDLELFGDLRRSIIRGKSMGKNVIGFSTNMARLIAQGQQQQTRKTIFSLSTNEINESIQVYFDNV